MKEDDYFNRTGEYETIPVYEHKATGERFVMLRDIKKAQKSLIQERDWLLEQYKKLKSAETDLSLKSDLCPECKGEGTTYPGREVETCKVCKGTGRL